MEEEVKGDSQGEEQNISDDDIIEEELDYIQEKLRVHAKLKKASNS